MENILTLKEMEREIMAAEMAQRPADFSNKIIQEINLSEMEIKIPLSFERAKILGRVYCNKTIFHQDLNFNSAILNRIFYSGESIIKGNFNCQGIKVREGMNLVGATIEKNINLEAGQIKGFLGLNKIKILGEANFRRIMVQNLEEVTGTIEGDVLFQKAKVKNLDLEGAIIDGTLDFQGITIFGFLNLTNAEIKGILLLKSGVILGEVKSEGLKYKEKII